MKGEVTDPTLKTPTAIYAIVFISKLHQEYARTEIMSLDTMLTNLVFAEKSEVMGSILDTMIEMTETL